VWGQPEGKRPLGRPRRMWGDDIKMDLQNVGWERMVWIDDSRGQAAGSCGGGNEPLDAIMCGEKQLASQEGFCSME
jgi:hypothetical protein